MHKYAVISCGTYRISDAVACRRRREPIKTWRAEYNIIYPQSQCPATAEISHIRICVSTRDTACIFLDNNDNHLSVEIIPNDLYLKLGGKQVHIQIVFSIYSSTVIVLSPPIIFYENKYVYNDNIHFYLF